MIEKDNVLCFEDFVDKYEKELNDGNITDEIKENMYATILDEEECRRKYYKFKIENFYIAMIEILKIDYPDAKIESFVDFVKAYCFINEDKNIHYDHWDIDTLCKEAYNDLYNKGIYTRFMKKEMPDEFDSKHMDDMEFYVELFKKNSKRKDLIDVLNCDIWRYM